MENSNDNLVDRLEEFKNNADQWIDQHAAQFDPLQWSDIEKRRVRRKAFAEAAIYLCVAESHDDINTPRLNDLFIKRGNDKSFYQLLARNPTEFNQYSYPLIYLSQIDELSHGARQVLEDGFDRSSLWLQGSLPPFRQLDLWHLCKMYDYEDHDLNPNHIFNNGHIVESLNPAVIDEKDVYAFTHEVLYYHNLGSGDKSFSASPFPYKYPSSLHGLLLRFMAEGHTDLVGELLFVGVLERQLPFELARFAFNWLLDQVSDDGYVPAPGDGLPIPAIESPEELNDLDLGDWGDDQQHWASNYHPTLVGSMLARVTISTWPEINCSENQRAIDYKEQKENIFKLGNVFSLLSDYDLEEGATLLQELAETPVVDAYKDVVEHAIQFLEYQRRMDGKFGYWTDEKRVYVNLSSDRNEKSFEEELLKPVSKECELAIELIRNSYN